jgi:hypothetical protein
MSLLTDILDRLSGITALRERVTDLAGQFNDLRRLMLEQQREIAGLQGQLRALIHNQSQAVARTAPRRSRQG